MHKDSIQDLQVYFSNAPETNQTTSEWMDRVQQRISSIYTDLQQKIDQIVAELKNTLRAEIRGQHTNVEIKMQE